MKELNSIQTSEKPHLKAHIKGKHEGLRFSCQMCDFETLHDANLRRHIKIKHN